jgi:hypothetical protein
LLCIAGAKAKSPLPPFQKGAVQVCLALLIAALLTASLGFDYLIGYERLDYARRILFIAAIFALPLALNSIAWMAERISSQEKSVRIIFLISASLALTASLYLSFPRKDNYFNSRGYSTSAADIEAVNWIEQDAAGKEYIVLANQQVSAAALREFGFKKYYDRKSNPNEKIFYYPIPTGGKLYNLYLDMVYEYPLRDTIKKALDITGAQTGYFVIDKYWWAYKKVADEAELASGSKQSFNNGEVLVFKYE